LALRSHREKFALDVAIPADSPDRRAVRELIRAGYAVHLDRVLGHREGDIDVYLLTATGVALAEAEGIPHPALDEHLLWAKARAREYLDRGDNPGTAVASLLSDLATHERWAHRPGSEFLVALFRDFLANPSASNARNLIERFDG
jgi:hypothetical protein